MQKVYLIRHGETEWSKSGQHTGLTDIPLTENGKKQAKALGKRVRLIAFDHVFSSPLKRAYDTCTLCGLREKAIVTDDLLEWNYGDYEGKKTIDIHKIDPHWNIFTNGGPHGETVEDIQNRTDRFLTHIRDLEGNIAVFSSGHFSRALATQWLGLPLEAGQLFILSTGSLSILSHEHQKPALLLWNDISHHHS